MIPQAEDPHHVLKGVLNGTDHQALMGHCFLQVKPWHSIVWDLPMVLCRGHLVWLCRTCPCVMREADGRWGGVLQDLHKVPELLTDVQVEPLRCHDSSTTACMAIKQGPVVEIKTFPALQGEEGRLNEPARKGIGWEIQSSWGHQLRTVTQVSQVSVQAGATWAADQGYWNTPDPWLEPTPDTSCLWQPPGKGRHHGTSTAATSAAHQGTGATGLPGPASPAVVTQGWRMVGAGRKKGHKPRESPVCTLPRVPSHALLLGIFSVVSLLVNHHSSHPIQLPAAFPG